MKEYINNFFDEGIAVKQKSKELLTDRIIELVKIFDKTFKNGNKIIVFGNGGCASIAQQMTAAFIGRFKSGKDAQSMICLSSEASLITNLANDFGFEKIYIKQLEGLLNKNDVVIGLSTSGNSTNVVKALEYAKEYEAFTIGFTGEIGGKLSDIADFIIRVPSIQPSHIESILTDVNTLVCKLLD